jgi:mono/diheme cytochrome c family protein
MKKILLIVAVFIAVSALSFPAFAQTKAGDAAKGKVLFEKYGCYQCHGWQGQGGLAGARLSQTKLPQSAFIAFVRNPPSGSMPPFRAKILSDQDLADIYAHVKAIPESKAAKDIPILNEK